MVRARIVLLALLLLGSATVAHAWAQEGDSGARLEIKAVDRSDFPTVAFNLIATDVQSRPLESLDALRLRENGVPIADFDLQEVAVGLDLIFILDAIGPGALGAPPGTAWLRTVEDTLLRFGGRYMEAGRDEVSLLVPAGEDGRWLVENSADPGVLATALDGYQLATDQEPQTLALLARALVSAEQASAPPLQVTPSDPRARFQAIVLFTSATRLNRYLFPPLVERAQAMGVPIFVLTYGLEPAPTTLETLTWLYRPTRGAFAHLAEPAAADEIFEIAAANAVQRRLQYQSRVRETGRYSVTLSLHQAEEQLLLDLDLASPEVEISWADTHLRRVGSGPETALSALQPAAQVVPVEVTWSGGTARDVREARLLLDGEPQPAQVTGAAPRLTFEWDIASLDEGEYTLTAQVTDTLGLVAESAPHPLTVSVVRPAPLPTATPVPTATPASPAAETPVPGLNLVNLIAAGLGGIFLLGVGVTILLIRRRDTGPADPLLPPEPEVPEPLSTRPESQPSGAHLDLLGPATAGPERVSLPGANVLLGRDQDRVDIPLADSSVARLHARIRRRGDTFWLYDEGSAGGTFLNFERLGLAPRPLTSGDEIRIGRVRLRFHQDPPRR